MATEKHKLIMHIISQKMGLNNGLSKQKTIWLERRFGNIYIEEDVECDIDAIRQLLDEPENEESTLC
jgi:hypothetical protein